MNIEQTSSTDRLDAQLGLLAQLVTRIDSLLTEQVNVILHHPRFQQLEAAWRGLHYLVEQVADKGKVKVRVLNVSWRELTRDLEKAIEFDQSELFKKVYSQELDMPGGEPFGLLIGDYQVHNGIGPGHPMDDLAALRDISQAAAAAFAPFIAGVDPAFIGLESFTELERLLDLDALFRREEYIRWRSLREADDARFVALVLPCVLMRRPYEDDGSRSYGFVFRETVDGAGQGGHLWGNAAYAFAAVVIQSFENSSWTADIRGIQYDQDGGTLAAGGIVDGLPTDDFGTDRFGLVPKIATEVLISARQEKVLAEQGFVTLCHCRPTPWPVFYSTPSVYRPKQYDTSVATTNARLTAMLQYTLCAARFAHYLKVIARDKIGTLVDPKELEHYLQNWLQRYTSANPNLSMQDKARRPLREARVNITTEPGRPGSYLCVAYLRPHFQLEQLVGMLALETKPFEIELTTAASR